MTNDQPPDESSGESSTLERTRREFLAMAGVGSLAGCSIPGQLSDGLSTGESKGMQPIKAKGGLDLEGGSIENVSEISMTTDRPSIQTPGTGSAALEIQDTAAGEWSMRATEGSASSPGPVEFNAPITGAPTDGAGSSSIDVQGGIQTDGLSVENWSLVDVTQHGIDPDSGDDLGAFVDDHFNRDDVDGAVYVVPSGTYTWNTAVDSRSFDVFGIVGQPEATVRCTNPEMPYFLGLGANSPGNADHFFARNLTFDVQMDDVAASAILASVDESLDINNCRLKGELDRIVPPYYSIRPTLLTESGQGHVQVKMTDGSFYDPSITEQKHPMGLAIERDHRGYLVIENSDIEGFINNGIYSAGHNGKVAIRNTSVKNCGSGMLRLGDGDYAYKCQLVNDDAEDRGYSYAAVWVTSADHAVADGIEIEAKQRTPSELVRVNSDADHCSLSNFTIRSHANQYILEFTGSDPDIGQIVAKNWTINDTGGAQSNALLGRITRPNVVIENWDVSIDPADGEKRHGLVIDAPWTDVRGCSFDHKDNGLALLLDDDADYLRLKDCDFRAGTLYQYGRATVESAIVADNRFIDGTQLSGEQVDWTTRGPGYE